MSYLIDTNVLSEIRKGDKAHKKVRSWWKNTQNEEIFISVLVLAEVRRGIEQIRNSQPQKALMLENWLFEIIDRFRDRLLPINLRTADLWGLMGAERTLPLVDSLVAATAVTNNLTLVTRNTKDMQSCGARLLNPFEAIA
jgi:predicted nucleic acid-binding protein